MTSCGATRPIALHISCMTGLRPTMRSGSVLGRQHRRRLHQPGRFEGAVDDLAEPIEVHRLDEVIEGAAFHRLDGRLRGAVRGDEDHRQPRVLGVQLLEQVQAGAVGQLQVEHDDIGIVSCRTSCQPLGGRARP